MSREERARWNARYRGGEAPSRPSRVLAALSGFLSKRGRALDVAGGAGRHAAWLARRGLAVTVVDVAEEGLAIAARRAKVRTVRRDLDRQPLPPGPWDLILVFHYLNRRLWKRLPRCLAPGGMLVVVQPTVRNLERHPRPRRRHLVREGEMATLFPRLEALFVSERWSVEGRHEAVYLGRAPATTSRKPLPSASLRASRRPRP